MQMIRCESCSRKLPEFHFRRTPEGGRNPDGCDFCADQPDERPPTVSAREVPVSNSKPATKAEMAHAISLCLIRENGNEWLIEGAGSNAINITVNGTTYRVTVSIPRKG